MAILPPNLGRIKLLPDFITQSSHCKLPAIGSDEFTGVIKIVIEHKLISPFAVIFGYKNGFTVREGLVKEKMHDALPFGPLDFKSHLDGRNGASRGAYLVAPLKFR